MYSQNQTIVVLVLIIVFLGMYIANSVWCDRLGKLGVLGLTLLQFFTVCAVSVGMNYLMLWIFRS